MDCPLEMSVFEKDREVGTLKIKKEGLYYRLTCAVRIEAKRVLRIYLIDGLQSFCAGVLMPKAGELVLEKKISVQTWKSEKIDAAIASYVPLPGWYPWCGEVDGIMTFGWLFREETHFVLAVEQNEFPFVENLADAEARKLDGIECLCISLDRSGKILSRQTKSESQEDNTGYSE